MTTPTLYGDEPEETQGALLWAWRTGATIGWLRCGRWRIADPPLWHPEGVYKVLSPDELAQIKDVENMSKAPERIWTCAHVGEYGRYFPEAVEAEGEYGGTAMPYVPERDLDAALAANRELVRQLAAVRKAGDALAEVMDIITDKQWAANSTVDEAVAVDETMAAYRAATTPAKETR